MTARTIVAVEPGFGENVSVKLFRAPAQLPGMLKPEVFPCDPDAMPPWQDDRAVELHGKRLREFLEVHPAIRQALASALAAPPNEKRGLYFWLLDVPDAERLCWETLCDDQGRFLALDRRFPIARIAHSGVDRPSAVHTFEPPLRLLAVLSAAGVGAAAQWTKLKGSLAQAEADGLAVRTRVLVGERELFETLQAEVAAGLAGVEVDVVPTRVSQVEREITDFAPHFLHLFCHGSVSHGVSRLELATPLDWAQGLDTGSIQLQVDQLTQLPGIDRVWLVTLNCCEGGRAAEDMQSMAYSLVAHGVPAAVGMLEPFAADDAHEFCAGFYSEVFAKIAQTVRELDGGGPAEVEWAETLRACRLDLCQRHDDEPWNRRQWAMPVLYVRLEPFELRRAAAAAAAEPAEMAAMRMRAELVAGQLRALGPEGLDEVRDQLLALVADLPAELRPDRQGNFPG